MAVSAVRKDVRASNGSDELETLRADLERVSTTLAALLGHRIEDGKDALDEARAAVHDQMASGLGWVKASVRSHPSRALGIAAGIGFLAALMLARRPRA